MPWNPKEYPKDWKYIRARILLRDNNCCKFCGVPNYSLIFRPKKGKPDWRLAPEGHQADAMALDGIKFTKIVLTIAHLDHDKLNHDVKDDRLAALCQRCHLVYDNSHHVWNRKYGRNASKNQGSLFNSI